MFVYGSPPTRVQNATFGQFLDSKDRFFWILKKNIIFNWILFNCLQIKNKQKYFVDWWKNSIFCTDMLTYSKGGSNIVRKSKEKEDKEMPFDDGIRNSIIHCNQTKNRSFSITSLLLSLLYLIHRGPWLQFRYKSSVFSYTYSNTYKKFYMEWDINAMGKIRYYTLSSWKSQGDSCMRNHLNKNSISIIIYTRSQHHVENSS